MCSDLFESNGKKVVEGWKRIQYMLLSVHVVRFRKKTITLAPNIEGLGADERDDGSSPPPPRYNRLYRRTQQYGTRSAS